MCHYYYIIIDFVLNLLIFVASVKEGNSSLSVSSLKQVVKLDYACDYYYHARWVKVYLCDLVNLPSLSLYLYKCFQAAIEMGIDQEHEQNKAVT